MVWNSKGKKEYPVRILLPTYYSLVTLKATNITNSYLFIQSGVVYAYVSKSFFYFFYSIHTILPFFLIYLYIEDYFISRYIVSAFFLQLHDIPEPAFPDSKPIDSTIHPCLFLLQTFLLSDMKLPSRLLLTVCAESTRLGKGASACTHPPLMYSYCHCYFQTSHETSTLLFFFKHEKSKEW